MDAPTLEILKMEILKEMAIYSVQIMNDIRENFSTVRNMVRARKNTMIVHTLVLLGTT